MRILDSSTKLVCKSSRRIKSNLHTRWRMKSKFYITYKVQTMDIFCIRDEIVYFRKWYMIYNKNNYLFIYQVKSILFGFWSDRPWMFLQLQVFVLKGYVQKIHSTINNSPSRGWGAENPFIVIREITFNLWFCDRINYLFIISLIMI